MNKKERIDRFFANKEVDRVPVGLWHHFVSFHNHYSGMDEDIYKKIIDGQKKYIDDTDPDFVKIMSDGFFGHPSVCRKTIKTVDDLREVVSVGGDDPWISKQIEYVNNICKYAGDESYKFYSLFSPLQYIRLRFEEYDEDFEKFVRLFREDPEVMIQAAENIAADIKLLIERLFKETPIDGIFYSVQGVQSGYFNYKIHQKYVQPLDLELLDYINKFSSKIILHICGYGHYTNHLNWYKDYPVAAFNWAVFTENVSLAEGKKIFGGKPVIGGFDNNPNTLLDKGTDEEVKAYIIKELDEAGTIGVGLGADCTISQDIPVSRINYIKQVSEEYSK